MPWVDRLVPHLDDLPGRGWRRVELARGEGSAPAADVLAAAGNDFPDPDEIEDSASSAHFVRRRQLVHGLAVVLRTPVAADRAAVVLGGAPFARELGRSVAADLAGGGGAEILAADVSAEGPPFRVTFTGVSSAGALPVHLDVVILQGERAVTLLWFADGPEPFPFSDRTSVTGRLLDRLSAPPPAQ